MQRPRPFGVTLLAILAAIAGLVAAYRTFQYLHILPFSLGPVAFYGFDLLGALLWGITTIIYAWLVSMLWTVNAQGWMFCVIISIVNLILAGIDILGQSSLQAELPALVINAIVLIYCLLPSTKRAFGGPLAAA
jgi:small-conductance mechanosensitive channel